MTDVCIQGKVPGVVSGSFLVGASEHASGATGRPCVLGRERAAVRADGCAQRPREDLTEATTVLSARPVAADCGPGGAASASTVLCPAAFTESRCSAYEQARSRKAP